MKKIIILIILILVIASGLYLIFKLNQTETKNKIEFNPEVVPTKEEISYNLIAPSAENIAENMSISDKEEYSSWLQEQKESDCANDGSCMIFLCRNYDRMVVQLTESGAYVTIKNDVYAYTADYNEETGTTNLTLDNKKIIYDHETTDLTIYEKEGEQTCYLAY